MAKATKSNRRTALVVLAALAAIAGVVVVAMPRLTSGYVERTIRNELQARGLFVSELDAALTAGSNIRIRSICINDFEEHADSELLCAENVEVSMPLGAMIRREPEPSAVRAGLVRIDVNAERGTIPEYATRIRSALGLADDEVEEEDAPDSSDRKLPDVDVDTIEFMAHGQPVSEGTHRLRNITVRSEGDRIAVHATAEPSLRLPESIQSNAGDVRWTIAASAASSDDFRISLSASEPVRVEPSETNVNLPSLSLDGVGFTAPYTVHAANIRAASPELGELLLSSLEVSVNELTTNLTELKFARAVVEGLNLSAAGPLHALIREMSQEDTAGRNAAEEPTPAQEPGSGNDADGPTANASPGLAQRIEDELRRRDWWEVVPQRVVVRSSRLELPGEGGDSSALTVEIPELAYTLRLVPPHMELSGDIRLISQDNASGSAAVRAEYNYQRRSIDLTLDAENLTWGSVPAQLGLTELPEFAATYTGALTINGRKQRGYTLTSTGAVTGFSLDLALLEAPVQFEEIAHDMSLSVDLWSEDPRIELSTGALQIDGARLLPRVEVAEPGAFDMYPAEVLVELEIPRQPAMQLVDAVPDSILGPLEGMQLGGEYGLNLEFPITFGRDRDGDISAEVGEPTLFDVDESTLVFESLPEEVDVTRLNSAFSFRFRGPEDRYMRRLSVPAPELSRAYPTVARRQGSADGGSSNWVPLDEISFYLVATQLYREDGSFFRNSGINWFQLRWVIGEAIATRSLGRGASTITMQLVKNVFLSHERSIERKLRELFLAHWMTRTVPKERILEVYLNVIEWGDGILGITEAADYYFGATPDDLDLRPAVWLSYITPNPVDRGGGRPKLTVPQGSCSNCDRLIELITDKGWFSSAELRDNVERGEPAPPVDFIMDDDFSLADELAAAVPDDDDPFQRMSPPSRLREMIRRSRDPLGPGPLGNPR